MTDDLNNGSLNSFKERLEETERLAKNPTPENLLVLTKMAEYDELSDIRFFARKLLGICRRRMKQGIKESGGGEAEDKVLSEFFKFNKNLADDERQSAVIRIINNKNDFLGAVSGTKGQSAEKVAVRLLAVLNRYLVLHLKGTVLLSDETLATLIKAFGKYGGAGEIEKILPFLDHENSRVQANAIEALENIGDVRESAIKALENIGDVRANVINHIFSKLDNKDPRVRANAVIALKKFGGINSIKVIKKMIESGTASMSASAAYALRFFPAAENLYLVESLLKKQDANVRANAAAALVKFVGHGVEGAADLMKKNNITGEAPPADIEDIEAEIRSNEAAVEKLNEGLRSPDRERRIDAIKNAVSNNCYGIGEILLEALKKESDAHVIATIIIRLGFMEYKPAVNTIKEFLKSADDRIRANAVEAIGRFGPSSSGRLKELRSFIDDPCCRVRANAIVALKKEKIAGVYPSLLQMIRSGDIAAVRSAVYAVMELDDEKYYQLFKEIENKYGTSEKIDGKFDAEAAQIKELLSKIEDYRKYIDERKISNLKDEEIKTLRGKTFRVFFSSTFSDMKAERNELAKEVYPYIRKMCEEKGYRFQAIDLRWGVSDDAALGHQTMKICLDEIARCRDISPRPNFVVLLGDRYGWMPLPSEIPSEEFEEIINKLKDDRSGNLNVTAAVDLLNKRYALDENQVPAVYCLKPREIEPFMKPGMDEAAAARAEKASWEADEAELRKIFVYTFNNLSVSTEDKLKYALSATAQEVVHGAIKPDDASKHVFVFMREIAGLPKNCSAREYTDLVQDGPDKGKFDETAGKKLEALKANLQNRLSDNIFTYGSKWKEVPEKISGKEYERLKKYIDYIEDGEKRSKALKLLGQFIVSKAGGSKKRRSADVFYEYIPIKNADGTTDFEAEADTRALLRETIAGYSDITTAHVKDLCRDVKRSLEVIIRDMIERDEKIDALEKEILLHDEFGRERCRIFHGQEEELDKVEKYILSGSAKENSHDGKPLLVCGVSGSGKTAFMAEAAKKLREGIISGKLPEWSVVSRYIGTTPESSDIRKLLQGICGQIYRDFELEKVKDARLSRLDEKSGESKEDIEREFEISGDLKRLSDVFAVFLRMIPRNRRLAIFIDAADQLRDVENARSLTWLPAVLPAGVKIILSASLNKGHGGDCVPDDCGAAFEKRFGHRNVLKLPAMKVEDARKLLKSLFEIMRDKDEDDGGIHGEKKTSARKLTVNQENAIIDKFKECPYPLFIKLAYEEARYWKSFEKENRIGESTDELIRSMYERLAKKHDALLVERSLAFLAAAKNGLSEDELLDLLVFDDEYWLHFLKGSHHEIEVDFNEKNIINADGFINKLAVHSDPVSKKIYDYLPENIQSAIDGYGSRSDKKSASGIIQELAPEIMTMLKDNIFTYDPAEKADAGEESVRLKENADFEAMTKHLDLPENIVKIMKSVSLKISAVNYWILEKAFSKDIARGERKLPIVIWARLYFELQYYLNERAADGTTLLNFYYRQMREAAAEKYMGGGEAFKRRHRLMAEYFAIKRSYFVSEDKKTVTPNLRKLSELPYHQQLAGMSEELIETLTDPGFVSSCCFAGMALELEGYYKTALDTGGEVQKAKEAPVKALFPIPAEELNKSVAIVEKGETAADRLKAFGLFVRGEGHNLHKYSSDFYFCAQQALNYAASGPVRRAFEKFSAGGLLLKGAIAELDERSRPPFNPYAAVVRVMEGHSGPVDSIALSGDGGILFSASADKSVRVWEASSGKCLYFLQNEETDSKDAKAVTCVRATPDARYAAAGDAGGRLIIFDVDSGTKIHVFSDPSPRPSIVKCAAISADGRTAVSGNEAGVVRVWDVMEKALIKEFKTTGGKAVTALAVTADGDTIVSGGEDRVLWLHRISDGKSEAVGESSQTHISSLAMTPDGNYVITGHSGSDGNVRFWDLARKECRRTFYVKEGGHSKSVRAVALTPDARVAVSIDETGKLCVWNMQRSKLAAKFEGISDGPGALEISADGTTAFVSGDDRLIKTVDIHGGVSASLSRAHRGRVNAAALNGGRKTAVTASGVDRQGSGSVKLWDLSKAADPVELKGHSLGVEVLAMAPGGKTFVSGGIDSTLRVWNTADIEKHAVLSGHSGAIVAAVMDADRGYVFSAGSDGKIIRWNLKTDLPDPGPDHFRTGDSSSVLALAASRDSSLLVSSGIDGALKIWDAASGECRRSFERRLVTPGSFAVSPDASKMAMIGRDGHIYMYDARKDEERLLKISGDGELFIELLAFRSSGKELVACARSGLIGVYDPYDGKALGTVKPAGGYINSMAIFAGERRLLTHNGDNTLRLYEFESGGPGSEVKIVPLQIIPFTMRLTAFAASGDMIAAGDGAGYVRFFKIKVL